MFIRLPFSALPPTGAALSEFSYPQLLLNEDSRRRMNVVRPAEPVFDQHTDLLLWSSPVTPDDPMLTLVSSEVEMFNVDPRVGWLDLIWAAAEKRRARAAEQLQFFQASIDHASAWMGTAIVEKVTGGR